MNNIIFNLALSTLAASSLRMFLLTVAGLWRPSSACCLLGCCRSTCFVPALLGRMLGSAGTALQLCWGLRPTMYGWHIVDTQSKWQPDISGKPCPRSQSRGNIFTIPPLPLRTSSKRRRTHPHLPLRHRQTPTTCHGMATTITQINNDTTASSST